MSKPSFENIDRWFFEYVEGNLSPQQIEQLERFLDLHPELLDELEAWKTANVEPEVTDVSYFNLQKTAFFTPRIALATALISILVIGSGVYFWNYQNATSLYLTKSIDTHIIEISELQNETTETNYVSNDSKIDKTVSSSSESFSQTNAIGSTSNTKISNSTISSDSDFSSNINFKGGAEKKASGNNLFRLEESGLSEELSSRDSKKVTGKNYESVLAYFEQNESSQSLEAIESNDITSISRIKHSKKQISSSSSMKRKFQNTMKKIKRMADQPIALQNSRATHFHVPNMVGFQPNFGMVGTLMRDRVQIMSRNQWVGTNNQQLMNTFSWDSYIYALRGGLGIDLNYTNFQDGSIEDMHAGFTYSPKLSVTDNISIEPALRFKMGTTHLNVSSDVIGNRIERTRQVVEQIYPDGQTPLGNKLWYRDMGVGMLVNTKWFFAGVNMDNVRRHYNNIYSEQVDNNMRANHHFTATIGTEYAPLKKEIKYSTYLFYQKFGNLNELWLGGSAQWRWLELGGGISNNLDVAASGGLKLNQLAIHYNIDYVNSMMLSERFLSHQISLRYLLKPNRYAAKYLTSKI